MKFSRVVLRHEALIFLTLIVLAFTVGTINPVFFSIFNVFSLLKNSTVIGLFAIGFFLVLVTGGLDVSFMAVGVTAMYCTVKLAVAYFSGASFLLLCAVSALIGIFLGLINGLLVTQLRAPSLIVTLGTLSLFRGFLLFFVGNDVVRQVPQSINDFARTNVINVTTANGAHIGLHASVVIFVLHSVASAEALSYESVREAAPQRRSFGALRTFDRLTPESRLFRCIAANDVWRHRHSAARSRCRTRGGQSFPPP
jgi:simple sugar transport system permease protein